MLKKTILYLLVFLLAFSVFVLAKAPARVIWEGVVEADPSVTNSLRSVGVSVKGIEGTIWDGRALVQYKGIASIVDWDVKLSELYALSLPVKLDIDSQAGELEAVITVGMSDIAVTVSRGDLDLSMLSPALRAQRVTLDGQLLLKDIQLLAEDNMLRSAAGMISWSGGDIAYPAQRAIHQRSFPPFRGVIETSETGEIKAGVRDSGGSFDVIEATVSPEGEALVKVKRRLLDLADEHWPQNSKEEDVVFKVKKKIY